MKTTFELCPFCENEVELFAQKYVMQECPVCRRYIRACSMCEDCNLECEKQ